MCFWWWNHGSAAHVWGILYYCVLCHSTSFVCQPLSTAFPASWTGLNPHKACRKQLQQDHTHASVWLGSRLGIAVVARQLLQASAISTFLRRRSLKKNFPTLQRPHRWSDFPTLLWDSCAAPTIFRVATACAGVYLQGKWRLVSEGVRRMQGHACWMSSATPRARSRPPVTVSRGTCRRRVAPRFRLLQPRTRLVSGRDQDIVRTRENETRPRLHIY